LRFEKLLDEYSDRITSIRFRYFNAAGAAEDGSLGEAHDPETHLIPSILAAIIGGKSEFTIFGDSYPTFDGTCVRDYIHVCDLAQAHLLGIEALGCGEEGGVYNLGNGKGFSNREILEACVVATGRQLAVSTAPSRQGDPAVLVASAEAARKRFGWQPCHADVDSIISHAYAWHKSRT
jgi:UDP-glucose 4-epimerase